MHASIAHYSGDPGELMRSYDAMLAAVPAGSMRLHLCLRAADGLVVVDTCPSRADFEAFSSSEAFRALRAAHGLPEAEVIRKVFLAEQPTRRFVTVAEVAGTVTFLCSPAAASITGAAIPIDGGWTAH